MSHLLSLPGITWYGILSAAILVINGLLQLYSLVSILIYPQYLRKWYLASLIVSVAAGFGAFFLYGKNPPGPTGGTCIGTPIFDLGMEHSYTYQQSAWDGSADHGLDCAVRSVQQYAWGCGVLLLSCLCTGWCLYQCHIARKKTKQVKSRQKENAAQVEAKQ